MYWSLDVRQQSGRCCGDAQMHTVAGQWPILPPDACICQLTQLHSVAGDCIMSLDVSHVSALLLQSAAAAAGPTGPAADCTSEVHRKAPTTRIATTIHKH